MVGPHWNGRRWVSDAEWQIALRIKDYADRMIAYYNLPWYKRLFTRRPK